ncbi:hypothetical protein CBM2634_B40022 [Cupriavidus taiwanensis]|uniref:Uncharacterized protein n=1 Tax=Cupriavidus taiwanensis TaxID=164546 RepID=A0A375JBM9_9BURK|nr:hypothetical protein CBM2634_B40022 [Cupriavidus taiwanensis]
MLDKSPSLEYFKLGYIAEGTLFYQSVVSVAGPLHCEGQLAADSRDAQR